MKNLKLKFLTLVIASTLGLTLFGCNKFQSETSNSNSSATNTNANVSEKPKETAPPEEATNSFTAIDLSKQYKSDKKAMDGKYKGKEITVSGTISFNSSKSGQLGMITLEGIGITGDVKCWYEKEDQPTFGNLQKGQEVTVKGNFSGRFDSPDMQYCKVVAKK